MCFDVITHLLMISKFDFQFLGMLSIHNFPSENPLAVMLECMNVTA